MTKEKMLSKIYEVIADKTLSFGYQFFMKHKFPAGDGLMKVKITDIVSLEFQEHGEPCSFKIDKGNGIYTIRDIRKEIGHPVMIGDVLDWIEKSTERLKTYNIDSIIEMRKDKRKPIEDNPEAIDFVYSLIPLTDK